MQAIVHRGLLLRVERAYRAHQSFERITRNHFMTLVCQVERNPLSIGL